MKKIVRVAGCVSMVLLLSASMLYSAGSGSKKNEKMKKSGWIGVMIQDVSENIARKAKLDSEDGAYIREVLDESPADSAGIKEGDVCIEFNGRQLFDADDLSRAVEKTSPGTKVSVVVVRKGEKKTLSLIVGARKEMRNQGFNVMPAVPRIRVVVGDRLLGLQLLSLNEQLGEYFGAPQNEGVLVEEVEKESAGEKAGCKAGDIILRVGKKTVNKVEKVQKELQQYEEGDKVEVEVLRKGVKKVLTMEVEEDRSFHKNFFFHTPRMHMFRTDPFDDAEMRLEMDRLHPELDRARMELERTARDLQQMQFEIQGQKEHLILPSHSTI